jgi:integrase
MGRRGKREKLATGIFRDAAGHSVIVYVGGESREFRYPLDYDLGQLADARKNRQDEFHKTSDTDTFEADVKVFLGTIASKGRKRDASALLDHWIAAFPGKTSAEITELDIRTQLARWTKCAGTKKHLRQILGQFFSTMNTRSGRNPVRDVPRITTRYDDPRGLPYDVIEKILDAIDDRTWTNKKGEQGPIKLTKLRLRVMAYTGLPAAQLGRMTAKDVNLKAGTMHVTARRKGEGSPARRLPLVPEAIEAFKALHAAKGWGKFSSSSMAKTWRIAVDKAKAQWEKDNEEPWPAPENVRAYDLRHSFGTMAYAETGDLNAVAELLSHASLETTKRYAQAAVTRRTKSAVEALAKVFGNVPRGTRP